MMSEATRRLGIRYPIVQGPFGGGISTAQLVAAASNKGGLGSYGAQLLAPDEIGRVVAEIRAIHGACERPAEGAGGAASGGDRLNMQVAYDLWQAQKRFPLGGRPWQNR